MDHIGIDVHKKESQICILAKEGKLIDVDPGSGLEFTHHRPTPVTACSRLPRLNVAFQDLPPVRA